MCPFPLLEEIPMSRLRSSLTPVILAVAVLGTAVCGCIFNPTPTKVPPVPGWAPARSEAELIGQLKTAYQKRDFDTFKRLFHPDYQFRLNAPMPDGTTYWGLTEELRIHRRMFHPEDVQPPETPVLQGYWLVSVDIALTPRDAFADAPQFYFNVDTNPTGFHREQFAVTATDYVASVFFQTQGDTQFRVEGSDNFVIVNDLSKALGDDGKFLIYRWEDLGSGTPKPSATPAL
jgi:hypothetical protein